MRISSGEIFSGSKTTAAFRPRAVPRSAFVPAHLGAQAYLDQPLPIPHGQVTTQPSLAAKMIEALGLTGSEQVLAYFPRPTADSQRLISHMVAVVTDPRQGMADALVEVMGRELPSIIDALVQRGKIRKA